MSPVPIGYRVADGGGSRRGRRGAIGRGGPQRHDRVDRLDRRRGQVRQERPRPCSRLHHRSSYFGVRILGTEHYLVNTLHPYDGVRSLDRDGGESTGFEVRATGLWRIEVLPLSVIPSFNTSFKGDGDMVVRYTGDGSLAEITGNKHGGYFDVRAFGAHGTDHLVSTSLPYAGSRQISGGPQFFEVQAVGSWTITVK